MKNTPTVQLWDPLIRVFHLSIALTFFANYFFNEAGDSWHVWLGYYAAGWVLVRVGWGFIGPQSARWSDCWPTPTRLMIHLKSQFGSTPLHRLGHSPLGALVMLLMMLAVLLLGISGFLMDEVDALWGEDWPMDLHAYLADALLALVCLHVLAALVESIRLKENLPLSMLTGRRRDDP